MRTARPGFNPAHEVFRAHEGAELQVSSTTRLVDPAGLSVAYTPGVANVVSAIAADPSLASDCTWTSRLLAWVPEGVATMAPGAIVFALPELVVAVDVVHRHAAVVATGRSDHPHQINNVLAFPGVFDLIVPMPFDPRVAPAVAAAAAAQAVVDGVTG